MPSNRKQFYDVAVIGGGASGMIAAIEAARSGAKTVILEHLDKCGKKILATGNGKCNYTNQIFTEDCYRGSKPSFLNRIIEQLDSDYIMEYFKQLGIFPKSRNGYVYPYSEMAVSVNEALHYELRRLGVTSFTNIHVSKLQYNNRFVISQKDSDDIFTADRVILATGGMSGQGLGSDGSGYKLAEAFGHSIVPVVPALVQLKSTGKYLKTIAGVRTEGLARLDINGKNIASERGELLFTAYGISGIPILQLSRYASYALLHKDQVTVYLDFFPDMSENTLRDLINTRFIERYDKTNEEIFNGLLNKKLAYVILKECHIEPEGYTEISKLPINKLIGYLKAFPMNIVDNNGFLASQVTAGGISTDEISVETMQSKLQKGLYLAGEIIDIDGTCGGYNLHWAWASGIIAGRAAGKQKG